jgi:dTDP-4-dehydrorhamnose 3,5-epimerase
MKITPLSVLGAWEILPQQHGDPRGLFMEWYRYDELAEVVGHPLDMQQVNISTSAKDVVRGIHYAQVPPGQAKYITCVRGAVLDLVIDIREGSPNFGAWEFVRLDDDERRSVYLSEGLGHGFCALTDDATLVYGCSATFNPEREFSINPLDPELAVKWPTETPQFSARDAAAPPLAEVRAAGLLPNYAECLDFVASKSARFSAAATAKAS